MYVVVAVFDVDETQFACDSGGGWRDCDRKITVAVGRGGYPISAPASFVRHQLLLKSSFHFTDQKNDRGKGGKGKGICVCVCVCCGMGVVVVRKRCAREVCKL